MLAQGEGALWSFFITLVLFVVKKDQEAPE